MARVWLVITGVMALGTSAGCLITETPTFDAPRRTAPFLTNLDPPTSEPQKILLVPGTTNTYEKTHIHFEVRSEDLGRIVRALLYVDLDGLYSPDNPLPIKTWELPPGTLNPPREPPPQESTSRTVDENIALPASIKPGCHPITVVASHDFVIFSAAPVEQGDVDTATWFYQVGVDETDPTFEYKPCEPKPRPLDAGADRRIDGGGL